jgi:succinate-semialdehyde dehydrogenase / glutarate-semialdehyde dehydrogenase
MHKILVNGAWVDALGDAGREIKNPATLELLGRVADCGPADAARALAAAKAAQPGWWRVPGVEKAKLLREIAARIRAREHLLATLMTQETGKPLCEAIDCIDWVAACFEYYGEIARSSYGNSVPPVAPHQLNFTIKEPFGVVAGHRALQFPSVVDGLEGRTGDRRRQHRGLQAAASESAVELEARRGL